MGLDKAAGCKQNASEIQLSVSEIYFRCNLNALVHGPSSIEHESTSTFFIFMVPLAL